MSDGQPKARWLARWREKQRRKRERTGDSEEKTVQRHTGQGRDLAAEDLRQRITGGGPGGGGGG